MLSLFSGSLRSFKSTTAYTKKRGWSTYLISDICASTLSKSTRRSDEHKPIFKEIDYTSSDKLHLFIWLLQTTFHSSCLGEREKQRERERKGSESNHQSNRVSEDVFIWRAGFTLKRSWGVRLASPLDVEGVVFFLQNTQNLLILVFPTRHDNLTSAKTLLSALSICLWDLFLSTVKWLTQNHHYTRKISSEI